MIAQLQHITKRIDSHRQKFAIFIAVIIYMLSLSAQALPTMTQSHKGDKLEHVTLHLKYMHAFQFAGYYAAKDQGYYQEAGLDVTINEALSGNLAINEVLSGSAEYGVWDNSLLNERVSGKPFVVLASIFQHSPYIILSRKDRNIRVPSDLTGRRVMIDYQMGMTQLLAILAHEGISTNDIEFVPHTWNINDLINGAVDASVVYITDQPNQMRTLGVEPFIIKPVDYGIDFYGDCLFTTESEIKHHPKRVAAFRQASLKGWEYAMRHVDEIVELIIDMPGAEQRGLTAEHLRYEADQMQKLILPELVEIGHINPWRWKHMADTCAKLGILDSNYSLDGFIYDPNPSANLYWIYIITGILTTVAFIAILAALWIHQLHRAITRSTHNLKASEERFRQMFDNMSSGVVVYEAVDNGKDFILKDFNPSVEKIENLSRENMIGKRLTKVFPAAIDMGMLDALQRVWRSATPEHLPICSYKDNRIAGWRENYIYRLSSGEVIAVYDDRTAQKQSHEENERLRTAIEQADETIVISDTSGAIEFVNPAFCKITGYTQEEAIGQNPRILKGNQHDSEFYKELWDKLTNGDTWRGRFVNKKKDGTTYIEDAVISPVRNDAGETVNYVAVKRDITSPIAMERHLHQAQKIESVGMLAGGIAHDFNNLLTGIMGYVELCQLDVDPDSRISEWLNEIMSSAKRSADLTRQLLTFARKQVIAPKLLNLNDTISGMLNMLRRLIGENVELIWQPGANIKPTKLDAGQINQILVNLCLNSRDAISKYGEITVETENVAIDADYCTTHLEGTPGEYILLTVSDNGCGMEQMLLDKILEPFFTTKEMGKGTGLGLSTVYGIVKQNNGFINIDSELGKGSTFNIYLPQFSGNIAKESDNTTIKKTNQL